MRLGVGLAHGGRRLLWQECVKVRVEHRRFGQRLLPTTHSQVVKQRKQNNRDVAMATGQALEIIRQLHQAAHQRGIGLFAMSYLLFKQRRSQCLHLCRDHGCAIQLDHPQGAMHLMQMTCACAHVVGPAGIVDIGLQRLAGDRQGIVELRLDPLQCGEIDVVLKSHAPLSAIAQCKHSAISETAPRLVLISI